jgi:glucosamine--fructose-6-phosphate aminotransferase (isomerizing)
MCGIIGYVGQVEAKDLLINGLEKLEYRGYDSAGIAVCSGKTLKIAKAKGKLEVLRNNLKKIQIEGKVGIGHTRWATHGEPSQKNSHPHISMFKKFAIVHNGIIENYLSIKEFLISKGKKFSSETDTEVIVQLLEYYDSNSNSFLSTLKKTLHELRGSYALGIISTDYPNEIIAVKKGSPLIIGVGQNENSIASDITAIISRTKKIIRLKDNEIAVIRRSSFKVYDKELNVINKKIEVVNWNIDVAEKCGYRHFMLKEIMEQPKAVSDTLLPRIKNNKIVLDNINLSYNFLKNLKRIIVTGCGSAYHVACVAKYFFEKLIRKPVEIDIASEFRYRGPILDENVLVVTISQSGETADTLAAVREAKKLGARVLSIVNIVGSSIDIESDEILYTHAGPEIAVATTKAYSAQLAAVYLLGIYMANKLNILEKKLYDKYIDELLDLSNKIKDQLKNIEKIELFAKRNNNIKNVFFIGRNLDYATALEGSLKFKEISYVHSEAYPAGELKHGTISLIEDGTLVIAIITQKKLVEKTISNIKEVKARGAYVLGVTSLDNSDIYGSNVKSNCNDILHVQNFSDIFSVSLSIIPLQLLSYYVALNRGCDIDKPRNLAKSVTVE